MRHLGVVDEAGSVIGALSARDLLRLRAGKALRSAMRSRRLKMVHDLARAWAKLPQVVASLLAEVVNTPDVPPSFRASLARVAPPYRKKGPLSSKGLRPAVFRQSCNHHGRIVGVCVRSWAEFSSDRGLVDPQSSRLAQGLLDAHSLPHGLRAAPEETGRVA